MLGSGARAAHPAQHNKRRDEMTKTREFSTLGDTIQSISVR